MTMLRVYDGSHLVHRSYHASRASNKGSSVDDPYRVDRACYFFFNSIMKDIRSSSSDCEFLFLFDSRGSSDRKKSMDSNYKSNRTPNPEVLEVFTKVHKILDLLHLPKLGIEGYEADDIAYVLSKVSSIHLTFITEDMDWISFLNDRSVLVRPIKGEVVTFDSLISLFSPTLDQLPMEFIHNYPGGLKSLIDKLIIYRKSMLGDGSDNISGIKGIGVKTVHKILPRIIQLTDLNDFSPKSTTDRKFSSNIDKFLTNTKVLGYKHLDSELLYSKISTNVPEIINNSYKDLELSPITPHTIKEIGEYIRSKDIESKSISISEYLNNVLTRSTVFNLN